MRGTIAIVGLILVACSADHAFVDLPPDARPLTTWDSAARSDAGDPHTDGSDGSDVHARDSVIPRDSAVVGSDASPRPSDSGRPGLQTDPEGQDAPPSDTASIDSHPDTSNHADSDPDSPPTALATDSGPAVDSSADTDAASDPGRDSHPGRDSGSAPPTDAHRSDQDTAPSPTDRPDTDPPDTAGSDSGSTDRPAVDSSTDADGAVSDSHGATPDSPGTDQAPPEATDQDSGSTTASDDFGPEDSATTDVDVDDSATRASDTGAGRDTFTAGPDSGAGPLDSRGASDASPPGETGVVSDAPRDSGAAADSPTDAAPSSDLDTHSGDGPTDPIGDTTTSDTGLAADSRVSSDANRDSARPESPATDTGDWGVGGFGDGHSGASADTPIDGTNTDTAPAVESGVAGSDTGQPSDSVPPPSDTSAPPADSAATFCALDEDPPNEGLLTIVSGPEEGLFLFTSDGTFEPVVPGGSLPAAWPCIGGRPTETWMGDAGLVWPTGALGHLGSVSGFSRLRRVLAAYERTPAEVRVHVRPTALGPGDWSAMSFGAAMSMERRVFRHVGLDLSIDGDVFVQLTLREVVALRTYGSDRCNDAQTTDYLDLTAPATDAVAPVFPSATALGQDLALAFRHDTMDAPLKIANLGRIPAVRSAPLAAPGRQGLLWTLSSDAPAQVAPHPPACWTPP